jgi:large subunit ribosomal protein L4
MASAIITKKNTKTPRTKKAVQKNTAEMKVDVYSQDGKKSSTVQLPREVFGLPWNADLVHQVVIAQQANARTPIAHTKMRGEVRGGGKKPWKQKGTGRARHGSRRSPIWVGGGVTHGPRNEKDYSKKVNRKMRTKALYTVLSRKFNDGELLFIENLSFDGPKTKDAKKFLSAASSIKGFEQLVLKKKNAAFIAMPKYDETAEKSFRNLHNVLTGKIRNINPQSVLTYKYIIFVNPESTMTFLASKKQ